MSIKYRFFKKKKPSCVAQHNSGWLDTNSTFADDVNLPIITDKTLNIWVLSHRDGNDLFKYEDCWNKIHIGTDLNPETECEYKDNTGDNISGKNQVYCELTGQYWVWKNAEKSDYVGFEHYRRHFNLSKNQILNILENKDIIVANKMKILSSIETHYSQCHSSYDMKLIENIVKDLFPEYIDSWDNYMKKTNNLYPCNMFITKWEVFNDMYSFLFSVFDEFEKRCNINTIEDWKAHVEEYSVKTCGNEHIKNGGTWQQYQLRLCGFLAERLITLWILHNIKPENIYETNISTNNDLVPMN